MSSWSGRGSSARGQLSRGPWRPSSRRCWKRSWRSWHSRSSGWPVAMGVPWVGAAVTGSPFGSVHAPTGAATNAAPTRSATPMAPTSAESQRCVAMVERVFGCRRSMSRPFQHSVARLTGWVQSRGFASPGHPGFALVVPAPGLAVDQMSGRTSRRSRHRMLLGGDECGYGTFVPQTPPSTTPDSTESGAVQRLSGARTVRDGSASRNRRAGSCDPALAVADQTQ